jgi:hypothetical protein
VALPFSVDYLSVALKPEIDLKQGKLVHREIGKLELSTGELVAWDPFVFLDAKPFQKKLPNGTFPVILSIEESGNDQRVAFATVRFTLETPVQWEMMLVGNQSVSDLKENEIFGYPVDSGTGCFMDRTAAEALDRRMRENREFFEVMMAEMEKTYRDTWSWLDMKFGSANLIAFSSGLGDGVYPSFGGIDGSGMVSVIVTDFGVIAEEDLVS